MEPVYVLYYADYDDYEIIKVYRDHNEAKNKRDELNRGLKKNSDFHYYGVAQTELS